MGCFASKDAGATPPPAGKPIEDWSVQEVAGWYDTLVSNVQMHKAVLLPEEGCVVARWTEQYLVSKGIPATDAMRIITYRDKAAAKAAAEAARKVPLTVAAQPAAPPAPGAVVTVAQSRSSLQAIASSPVSAAAVDSASAAPRSFPPQATGHNTTNGAPLQQPAYPAVARGSPALATFTPGQENGVASRDVVLAQAVRGAGGHTGFNPVEDDPATAPGVMVAKDQGDQGAEMMVMGVSLVSILSKGVTVAKVVIEKVGGNLPFPGSEASELILTLLVQVERAIANHENLKSLRDRAVAVLDILAAYHPELTRVRKYKGVVEAYKELLEGVTAYARAYTERNCLMRLLTAASDEEHYNELVVEMQQLSDRMMIAVGMDTNARLQHVQQAVEESRQILRAAARYLDPAAGARTLVAEMGGLEKVLADPTKLQLVVKELDVSAQVTIEVISSLLASHLDKGPQRHIRHPDLRLFWKRLYAGEVEVPWFVFWNDFPTLLRDNPMDEAIVEELVQLLSDEEVRAVVERAVERENTKDRVSVWELKVAFQADKGLLEQIQDLVDMALNQQVATQGALTVTNTLTIPSVARMQRPPPSMLPPAAAAIAGSYSSKNAVRLGSAVRWSPSRFHGGGTAFASAYQAAGAASVGMVAAAAGLTGGLQTSQRMPATTPSSLRMFAAEADTAAMMLANAAATRRQLPPLVSNYQGREEEALEIVAHLNARGSLALIAQGGLGKSCLATDVGWRLVHAGMVPAGALWVDLRDADTAIKVEARFCMAFGLQPEKATNVQRIVAAAKAMNGVAGEANADSNAPTSPTSPTAAGGTFLMSFRGRSMQEVPPVSAAGPVQGGDLPSMVALLVVDNAEDALLETEAAEAALGVLGRLLKEAPAMRLLVTSRTSLVPPKNAQGAPAAAAASASDPAPATATDAGATTAAVVPNGGAEPLLPEHTVGSISLFAAAQLVRATAADLTHEEATQVARACHCVPLVLCLVADALLAGRLTLEEINDLSTYHGPKPADTGCECSFTTNAVQHTLTIVLGSLKKQHACFAAQLAVFPSTFDYEEAAAVTDLTEAQVHALLAVLYRHSIVQRGGGTLDFVMHNVVRSHVAVIARKNEPLVLARAEGRFVKYFLGLVREWAAMYQTANEWQLALCMARANLPNISKVLDLLRSGSCNRDDGDDDQHLAHHNVGARLLAYHPSGKYVFSSYGMTEVTGSDAHKADRGSGSSGSTGSNDGSGAIDTHKYARLHGPGSPNGPTECPIRGWDPLLVAASITTDVIDMLQDLFVLMRLRAVVRFLIQYLTDLKEKQHQSGTDESAAHANSHHLRHHHHHHRNALPKALVDSGQEFNINQLLANVLYVRARQHQLVGRLKEAEQEMRHCLEIRRAVLSEDNTDTATAIEGVAYMLFCQDLLDEAEPMFRHALDIRTRVLGMTHPNTACSHNTLATCIDRQGRHQEAEPLFRKALELWRGTLGEEHPANATSLNHLAQCLQSQGRHEEAEALNRQALQLRRRVLGEDHIATSLSVMCLANCICKQGRHEEAEPLFRQVLDLRTRLLAEEHPAVSEALQALAVCLKTMGREDEATSLLERVTSLQSRFISQFK